MLTGIISLLATIAYSLSRIADKPFPTSLSIDPYLSRVVNRLDAIVEELQEYNRRIEDDLG